MLDPGAKGAPGSTAVCWTLGVLCGLLLVPDVPAKLAWLDRTADAFDAAVAGDAPPSPSTLPQPRARGSPSKQPPSMQRQGGGRFFLCAVALC